MKNQKRELSLINKETLKEVFKIVEIDNHVWHNFTNGKFTDLLTTEEVYNLTFCSNKELYYLTGTI